LLHVLIVTPAIFYTLRARELQRDVKRQEVFDADREITPEGRIETPGEEMAP